jgi:hypothetical protein
VQTGKPTGHIEVRYSDTKSPSIINSQDDVQYMVVEEDTFYDRHQQERQLRSSIAANRVYNVQIDKSEGKVTSRANADAPRFGLKVLSDSEILQEGFSQAFVDDLRTVNAIKDGFGGEVYRDYVANKYIVSFRGSDPLVSDFDDWVTNFKQAFGKHTLQHNTAMNVGAEILASLATEGQGWYDKIVVTGHSLGGGLASAAALTAIRPGDTFNAAGLNKDTLMAWNNSSGFSTMYDIEAGTVSGTQLIESYVVKYDVLTFVQDYIASYDAFGVYKAIGHRNLLYGPENAQIATDVGYRNNVGDFYYNFGEAIDDAEFIFDNAQGNPSLVDWVDTVAAIFSNAQSDDWLVWYQLSKRHSFYLYGLMHRSPIDIYGYTDTETLNGP